MKFVFAISLLLIYACPAFSQTCDGNTPEVVECTTKVLKKVDADLNVEYQRALRITKLQWTATDIRNLQDAQRKWIAYRDAVCKAEYGLIGGGTAGPEVRLLCLIRITQQRTADLAVY
jgi:uncharacterized protein YecT (DUF1311 family)